MHMLFTLRLSHRDGYLARLAAQSRIFIRLNMSYYEIIIILPLFTFFSVSRFSRKVSRIVLPSRMDPVWPEPAIIIMCTCIIANSIMIMFELVCMYESQRSKLHYNE